MSIDLGGEFIKIAIVKVILFSNNKYNQDLLAVTRFYFYFLKFSGERAYHTMLTVCSASPPYNLFLFFLNSKLNLCQLRASDQDHQQDKVIVAVWSDLRSDMKWLISVDIICF